MEQRESQLFIRADAYSAIGVGHVMRTLALAQEWGRWGKVTFLCCPLPGWLEERIADEGFSLREISAPHPASEDISETLGFLSEAVDPWVVLDGYSLDVAYQHVLVQSGYRLLLMDDGLFLEGHDADVLVNQNMGAERQTYTKCARTKYLLGAKYSLLRNEFLCRRPSRLATRRDGRHILITLGGSDSGNHSLKIIQALSLLNDLDLDATLVVGGSNPHWLSLSAAARDCKYVQLVRDVDMPLAMCRADIAITAGGSTCWELAFMGVPSIVLIVAENQVDIATAITEAGAGLSLGWAEDISAEMLAESVRGLFTSYRRRVQMAQAGLAITDGLGRHRVVNAMNHIRLRSTDASFISSQ